MINRIATIGDPHGTHKEFKQLIEQLKWLSLDEIYVVGDYVDRGEDSHAVIDYAIKNNIKGIKGNHDWSIINHWNRVKSGGHLPDNDDKKRTLSQLTQEDINYLHALPNLHVFDDLNLILVHGGLWPSIPLYAQPEQVIRAQMIKPLAYNKYFGFKNQKVDYRSRWWGEMAKEHASGCTEEENYTMGWRRWYHLWDGPQSVIFGHSTFYQPMIYTTKVRSQCIGIDTGSSFGGCLTACIYSQNGIESFMSVKNEQVYCESTTRCFWEAQ